MSSLNSEVIVWGDALYMKMKFFIAHNDYSCLLMLKSPNYGLKILTRDLTLKSYR
jgi:hypothetical protein